MSKISQLEATPEEERMARRCAQLAESYEMQRQSDRQKILELLDQFPPYHGPGYNYTKQEVEAWLQKARSTFMLKESK